MRVRKIFPGHESRPSTAESVITRVVVTALQLRRTRLSRPACAALALVGCDGTYGSSSRMQASREMAGSRTLDRGCSMASGSGAQPERHGRTDTDRTDV